MSKFSWKAENTATLEAAVAGVEVISRELQESLAEQLGTSVRSIGSKLRKIGYTNVAKAAEKAPLMTNAEVSELEALLDAHAGEFTYGEIAEQLAGGKFTTKQVQGKILGLQRTDAVKPTPKKEVVRKYSDAEETTFIELATSGASVEQIAEAMGRSVQQIRGKGLSLFREGKLTAIPTQAVKVGKRSVDAFAGLDVATMTVAEIVTATGKSERGVKSMLTRRGVSCADYTPKAKDAETAAE